MDEHRYWPFDVLPPGRRTMLHQQQIGFLDTAYLAGFRPFLCGSEDFGASAGSRYGYIFRRTRRFWELRVGAPEAGRLAAYVSGFDVNAEAVLRWLRGSRLDAVLEFIRPHVIPAGGCPSGYSLEPPNAAVSALRVD